MSSRRTSSSSSSRRSAPSPSRGTAPSGSARSSEPAAPDTTPVEWVGGRFHTPWRSEGARVQARLDAVLWVAVPSGLIVGQSLCPADDAHAMVGEVLAEALEAAREGPIDPPDRIRVCDEATAAVARGIVGDAVPVGVAPTPELDALAAAVVDQMPDPTQPRRFADPAELDAEAMRALFVGAARLAEAAPWRWLTMEQALRVDSPVMGIEAASVNFHGGGNEEPAMLLIPSLYVDDDGLGPLEDVAGERTTSPDAADVEQTPEWLALSYLRGDELTPRLRKVASQHGWPVASPDAYPVVEAWADGGRSRPVTEVDVEVLAIVAGLVAEFFEHHGESAAAEGADPICAKFEDDYGHVVYVTFPFEAGELFGLDDLLEEDPFDDDGLDELDDDDLWPEDED